MIMSKKFLLNTDRKGIIINHKANGESSLRVNVHTKVINSEIREELRNGRIFIVLPSKTLPDNIVMNGIMYPSDEIEKGYKTLEGTKAPLGHPHVNGEHVSANHPEAYLFDVGAFNRNVERKNGSVYIEKWIDKEYAKLISPELMEAINSGQPIGTSTGLDCDIVEIEGKSYKYLATNMVFDHDAILLHETPAAGIETGTGIRVNKSDKGLTVVNSFIKNDEVDFRGTISSILPEGSWIIDYDGSIIVYSDINDKEVAVNYKVNDDKSITINEPFEVVKKSFWERIFSAPTKSNEEDKMKEELDKILIANAEQSAKSEELINKLTESISALAGEVASIKEAQEEASKAVINAKISEKRSVVSAKFGDLVANSLDGDALDEMVAKIQPADGVIGGVNSASIEDELLSYEKE